MSQTQTQSKPPAADVQPAVFVCMAAVVRMTELGRSAIYRLMAEDKFPSPMGRDVDQRFAVSRDGLADLNSSLTLPVISAAFLPTASWIVFRWWRR